MVTDDETFIGQAEEQGLPQPLSSLRGRREGGFPPWLDSSLLFCKPWNFLVA